MAIVMLAGLPVPALAQDPSFISFSAGYFDMNRQKDTAVEVGVQWRGSEKLWIFQPIVGAMATFDGAGYVYGGISLDIFLGNRLVFRPSFAPGLYAKGKGYDLGHVVEFRSAAELAWRFDNRSRLGIEFYHLSNAHLGNKNPGEESLTLTYAIPIDRLFGK